VTGRRPTSFERDVFAPLRAMAPTLVGIDMANGADFSVEVRRDGAGRLVSRTISGQETEPLNPTLHGD